MFRAKVAASVVLLGIIWLVFPYLPRKLARCCSTSANISAFAQENDSKPLGGDLVAARYILDPHPAFNGMALDAENDIVVMSDTNRKSVLIYGRTAGGSESAEVTKPLRQI